MSLNSPLIHNWRHQFTLINILTTLTMLQNNSIKPTVIYHRIPTRNCKSKDKCWHRLPEAPEQNRTVIRLSQAPMQQQHVTVWQLLGNGIPQVKVDVKQWGQWEKMAMSCPGTLLHVANCCSTTDQTETFQGPTSCADNKALFQHLPSSHCEIYHTPSGFWPRPFVRW